MLDTLYPPETNFQCLILGAAVLIFLFRLTCAKIIKKTSQIRIGDRPRIVGYYARRRLFQRRHQRVIEDLLAAGPDRDLRGRVVQTVVALELGTDRLFQFGQAVNGGVFGVTRINRGLCGGFDV